MNNLSNTPFCYKEELHIDKEKKKDLMKLLQFIPKDCRDFYKNLKTTEK